MSWNPVLRMKLASTLLNLQLFHLAEPDRGVTSNAAADIVSLAPYVNAAATVFPLVSHGLCPPWISL